MPYRNAFPFGGKAEQIRYEHRRDALFVVVVDLAGPIHPGHCRAHRRLRLADHEREAVDYQHNIEPLLDLPSRVCPLISDDQLVVGRRFIVDKAHGHVLPVWPEGHGLLISQPFRHRLVGPNQSIGLHGQRQRAQAIDDLIGPLGFSRRSRD